MAFSQRVERGTGRLAAFIAAVLLFGAGVFGQTVIYVNAAAGPNGTGTSWATAYQDLQTALNQAANIPEASRNVEIWMARGLYVPSLRARANDSRSVLFDVPTKVNIRGGFAGNETSAKQRPTPWATTNTPTSANATVLSADLLANDATLGTGENAYRVLSAVGPNVLEGLVVEGANANDPAGTYIEGGGLLARMSSGQPVTVIECEFRRNTSSFGGAIRADRANTSAVAVISRSRFHENTAIITAVVGGTSGVGGAISGIVSVDNCIFASNSARTNGGAIDASSNIGITSSIVACTFAANTATQNGGAIYAFCASGTPSITIDSCLFAPDNGGYGSAVGADGSGTTSIRSCVYPFEFNYQNSEPHIVAIVNWQATVAQRAKIVVSNYVPASAEFVNQSGRDFRVFNGTGVDAGLNSGLVDNLRNRRAGDGDNNGLATPDIGAIESGSSPYPLALRVNAARPIDGDGESWATAFRSIPAAIAAAQANGGYTESIWIARGRYAPSAPENQGGSRSISFSLPSNLGLYGGFVGTESSLSERPALPATTADAINTTLATVLSGDLLNNDSQAPNFADNSLTVVSIDSNNTLLDGVTVTSAFGGASGGGIKAVNATSAVLRNVYIINSSSQLGGGLSASGSSLTLDRTVIANNAASDFGGGVYLTGGSTLTMRSSTVSDNRAFNGAGIALRGVGGQLSLVGSRLIRNRADLFSNSSAGGVFADANNATIDIVSTSVLGNYATGLGGGISITNATLNIFNSVFVGNTSPVEIGGILAYGCVARIINSTIASNIAGDPDSTAGVRVYSGNRPGASVVVVNSLLWRNAVNGSVSQSADLKQLDPTLTIANTTVTGWTGSFGGSANNGADPRFVRAPSPGPDNSWGTSDDDYGDLRLSPGSLAIDSGDSLQVPIDTLDIDGDGELTELLPRDIAGNPRFFDDLTVSNTGNGSPPVDRGAYENSIALAIWSSSTGGRWSDSTKWQGGVVGNSVARTFLDSRVGGTNFQYTVTVPSDTSVYSLGVGANDVTLNLRDTNTNGNLFILAPFGDPDAGLTVGTVAGLDTRLTLTNTGGSLRTLSANNATIGSVTGGSARLTARSWINPALPSTTQRVQLSAAGRLDVAAAGTAALTIDRRAIVNAGSLRLGVAPSSVATVDVIGSTTGSGSQLNVIGKAGQMIIGGSGSGTLNVSAQGALATGNLSSLVLADQPGSTGTMAITGAGSSADLSMDSMVIGRAGSANLTLTGGATLTTSTGSSIVLGQLAGSVANVTIGAGSSWTELNQSVVVGGAGRATLTVQPGGVVSFLGAGSLSIRPNGSLTGSGEISGGVFNVGTIRPGQSPGTLTINGDYRQIGVAPGGPAESGTVILELAGTTPGTQYDQLIINGSAELAGGLQVQFLNGFVPPANANLELVRAAGATGSANFDVAVLPALNDGRFLRVDYGTSGGPGGRGVAGFSVRLAAAPLGGGADLGPPQTAGVGGFPSDAVVADFNGDGADDLAIAVPAVNATGAPGSVVVLFSIPQAPGGQWQGFAGVGSQQTITVQNEPVGIDVGDLNGDGKPDLAVANASSNSVSVLLNSGSGTFPGAISVPNVGVGPVAVAIANIDPDPITSESLPEIAVACRTSNELRVLRSSAGGTAYAIAAGGVVALPVGSAIAPGNSLAAIDPDQDKNLRRRRLAVALSGLNSVVVVNNTAAARGPGLSLAVGTPVPVGPRPAQILGVNLRPAVGLSQAPNVGNGDVVTRNSDGTLSVLLGDTQASATNATFRPAVSVPVSTSVLSIASLDVDADGDPDLAALIPSGSSTAVQIIRNDYLTRDPSNVVSQSNTQPVLVPNAVPALAGGPLAKIVVAGKLSGEDSAPADIATVADQPPALLAGDGREALGPWTGGGTQNRGGPALSNIRGFANRRTRGSGTACNPADICGVGATYDQGAVDIGPDQQLTIEDFLNFLSAFGDSVGCPGTQALRPCSPADLCGVGATYTDGTVDIGPDGDLTIEDFLNFLSAFGDASGCL